MCGDERTLQLGDCWDGRLLPQLHGMSIGKREGQETEDDERIFDLTAHSNSSNRHRRAWLLRNTPCEQLVLCRDTDPTFLDAVKSEHLQRHGSRAKLRPETTKGMTNFTGSLPHVGAMRSGNPESGAYQKGGSVDSDIATYVNNRYEMDDDHKVKKAFWRRRTYTPGTLVDVNPAFPLPLGHVFVSTRTLSQASFTSHCLRCTWRQGEALRLIWGSR
jgi:hypothetical protein